jgi:hypothetical protein
MRCKGGEAGDRGVADSYGDIYLPAEAVRVGSHAPGVPDSADSQGLCSPETCPLATVIHSIHTAYRRMPGPHTEGHARCAETMPRCRRESAGRAQPHRTRALIWFVDQKQMQTSA